jgi:hypothetical protein
MEEAKPEAARVFRGATTVEEISIARDALNLDSSFLLSNFRWWYPSSPLFKNIIF